jgi:hypothetical protein
MTELGETALEPPPAKRRRPRFARRTVVWLAASGFVLLLLAGLLLLGKNAPPRAARLLPEADGIVYLDAAPMRVALHFDSHPVKHDPEYQAFIDATGIQFERDLNEAAFALHLMPNSLGPNGPVAFSSVFVGRFDRTRLAAYLAAQAKSQESYDGREIYDIPMEGRTDRVAILDAKTVAVSNTPTAEQIHSILDRRRTAFLPFSGNSLLARHYKDVPLFSVAWGMGKLAAGLGDDLNFFGLRVPLSVDATFIGSLRWTGALRLRVEEIAPNGPAATLSADSIEALLSVARTAQSVLPNALANPDTKTLLDSVEIEHHADRAVLTATIPLRLLQKLAVPPANSPANSPPD